jgi:hypothetical protein
MILEGLLTTTDAEGGMHLATMGPAVDDVERMAGSIRRLTLRPFADSRTASHLRQRPHGVFHAVDDVLLVARVVVDALPEPPPARRATRVDGWVLDAACQAWEFEVDEVHRTEARLRFEARVIAEHPGRPFTGFNRAAHAVIEGAILVTRLHLLGTDTVREELARLEPLVRKTGGHREHEAFALLEARAAVR